jgi:hypothetical protein
LGESHAVIPFANGAQADQAGDFLSLRVATWTPSELEHATSGKFDDRFLASWFTHLGFPWGFVCRLHMSRNGGLDIGVKCSVLSPKLVSIRCTRVQ